MQNVLDLKNLNLRLYMVTLTLKSVFPLYQTDCKESKDPFAGNKFTSLPMFLLTPCCPRIIPSSVRGTVNSAGARERAAHLSSTSDASPPNEES